MADIFQGEFVSAEDLSIEKIIFVSGDDGTEEGKNDVAKESTEQKEVNTSEIKIESVVPQPRILSLEELANSDFIRNRQLAAKSIVEYLHQAGSNKEALHSVISIMCKLSEDEELLVRSELMEHIPSIALFCKEHLEDLGIVIKQQIVPYTVKLLTDIQIQVRKIGHTTLLVLLENNIIDNSQLSEWICPLIAQLATSENTPDELRREDVSVMCKMIPYVGKEITEKFFLEPFLTLCCDPASSARKVCILNFGNICKVIGRETTESILLPLFLGLCQESSESRIVDISIDLASVVSPVTRHAVLSDIYIGFLKNGSRAVWYAACLSLGRFIATFADPSKTGLYYRDGIWFNIPQEDEDTEDPQNDDNYFERLTSQIISSSHFLDECSFRNLNHGLGYNLLKDCRKKKSVTHSPLTVATKGGHLYLHVDNENLFNNFQFWRTPLPEVELDIDIEECKSANINVIAKVHNEEDKSHTCASELNIKISPKQHSEDPANKLLRADIDAKLIQDEENNISKLHVEDFDMCQKNATELKEPPEKEKCEISVYDQNIVPPFLLMTFIDDVPFEEDLRINAAYDFPSVAYTLGRKYWPCLRDLFISFSTDIKFEVRKSVASYLHELAVILGRDITENDLLPVFLNMLRDVKLREIVLRHVSQFLKNLRPSRRRNFLLFIETICEWEEESNWRYRLIVAEQLIPCIELYTSSEALYFFPASLILLQDKVSAVRKCAVKLLAVIIKSIVAHSKSSDFLKAALFALDERYRKANKWLWRQMYVYICQELAVKGSLPTEFYVDEIIPNLFSLAWDSVPNVRLAVARCLGLTLLPLEFLPSIQRAHYQLLLQVMYSLQSDVDKDVRHFAHLSAAAFNVLPQKKLSPA